MDKTPSIEVIRWVKDHGGVENLMTKSSHEKQRARWKERKERMKHHIAELERKCAERKFETELLRKRIDGMRPRLMPPGMEWPTVDGKPVDFVIGYEPSLGVLEAVSIYNNGACEVMGHDGIIKDVKEIHVATPKVLDADGVEIRVGDRLYDTETGCGCTVRAVNDNGTVEFDGHENRGWFGKFFTHQRPVLDADGNRIEPAMDVWWVCESDERGIHAEKLHVESIGEDGFVTCDPTNGGTWVALEPSELYVTRPVLDADGVPIREGDVLYSVETGDYVIVDSIEPGNPWFATTDGALQHCAKFTHRAPVLAADGKPLEVGQTVWDTNGDKLVIGAIEDGGHTVSCRYADVGDAIPVHGMWSPSDLTHQRLVLDEIRRQRRDSVPRAAYERNLAKRQRQIDESHAALRRRNRWIAELEHLLCKEMSYSLRRDAGCLAPEALDADGVEIREGETVWHVETGEQCKVVEVDSRSVSVDFRVDGDGTKHTGSILPANLTHRKPVIAADGKPLREGETVYKFNDYRPYTLKRFEGKHVYINAGGGSFDIWTFPDQIIHERPDSWERIEADCAKFCIEYCDEHGLLDDVCNTAVGDASTRHCTDCGDSCEERMARDLVRRAKKLAERRM